MNVNSIRNKFVSLQEMIKQNIDVLNIYQPNFYQSLCRLDVSDKSTGLLVHVNAPVSSLQLSSLKSQFKMQALPFQVNLRKEKWLLISIFRLPLDSLTRFLDTLTSIIDFFSSSYNNVIVLGDFFLLNHLIVHEGFY